MDIFTFFKQRKQRLIELSKQRNTARKSSAKIRIKSRISECLDANSEQRLFTDILAKDPLRFPGYVEKIAQLSKRSSLNDAFICASGSIKGNPVICVELVSEIIMGSMGSATGEAVCRCAELAKQCQLPLVIFSASGGARMQEGIFSLMQMAKTAAAIRNFSDAGGLFISVLTNPTTGGVTASFASLGDITIAEPGALIGFAGPRVIEQTIGTKLPEGFQSAEFQLAHGFVDLLVKRSDLRDSLATILCLHNHQINKSGTAADDDAAATATVGNANAAATTAAAEVAADAASQPTKTAAEHVRLARELNRPHIMQFINGLFEDFVELHGDRLFADDRALIGGIARFEGHAVTVIGHAKGENLEKNIACNFGMAHPEGYRKLLRLAKAAEKFNRPIITFIDTPGAYPGSGAEERGQGNAIALCLAEFAALRVPVIAVLTGEGGSGGALALAVSDQLIIYQYAVYSILSPEGFASILWKDVKRADEAADLMQLTAADMIKFGIADVMVKEPEGGAHLNPNLAVQSLRPHLKEALRRLINTDIEQLLEQRYQRFRKF